jgi:hypothetical protein
MDAGGSPEEEDGEGGGGGFLEGDRLSNAVIQILGEDAAVTLAGRYASSNLQVGRCLRDVGWRGEAGWIAGGRESSGGFSLQRCCVVSVGAADCPEPSNGSLAWSVAEASDHSAVDSQTLPRQGDRDCVYSGGCRSAARAGPARRSDRVQRAWCGDRGRHACCGDRGRYALRGDRGRFIWRGDRGQIAISPRVCFGGRGGAVSGACVQSDLQQVSLGPLASQVSVSLGAILP